MEEVTITKVDGCVKVRICKFFLAEDFYALRYFDGQAVLDGAAHTILVANDGFTYMVRGSTVPKKTQANQVMLLTPEEHAKILVAVQT